MINQHYKRALIFLAAMAVVIAVYSLLIMPEKPSPLSQAGSNAIHQLPPGAE